ncbi:hypothetical protein [Francisella tularensis]|uniref:hypothetical protein n=1 Tax=Francisella tularensis TaxID=263 RepID=UPI001F45BA78
MDLQDDGGSSDIPAAEIFNNKNLRLQYFSEIQNKFLDTIFDNSLDSVIAIKYLDGNVNQIGVKLKLKKDTLVNAKELISSVSKQNAYISYVSEGISLLFVHYPNFTGIAPDNVITQKIQQQLSDPNNYYIRIAETTFKEPTDIYIENHILIYDTNSFNYMNYLMTNIGQDIRNIYI